MEIREIAVGAAGAVIGIGGAMLTSFADAVPTQYQLSAFSVGGLLVVAGLFMFLWAMRHALKRGDMGKGNGGSEPKDPRLPDGPYGVRITNSEDIDLGRSRISGPNPLTILDSKDIRFNEAEITNPQAPTQPTTPSRKFFGGFSFSKGDHLKKD